MRDRFLEAIATSMNVDPSIRHDVGVTVLGHPDRADNHVTAGYTLGRHLVVTCDPAVEATLRDATADLTPTLEAWERRATHVGGEFLGRVRMQLLGPRPLAPPLPAGYERRALDRDRADDLALITRLIEASDADDLDDAEIDLDELDATIEVAVGADGEIAAFASARPFDMAAEFGDIGVITRPDHRGRGVGASIVAALCARLSDVGLEPLYRCEEDNAGSVKLSAAIGFEPATQLVAFRFATD